MYNGGHPIYGGLPSGGDTGPINGIGGVPPFGGFDGWIAGGGETV